MPEPSTTPVRMTRQRRALEAALAAADGFRSAQDLHADLRASDQRVGLATVYSQLRQMAEAGQVDVVRSEAGEALYRACGGGELHRGEFAGFDQWRAPPSPPMPQLRQGR